MVKSTVQPVLLDFTLELRLYFYTEVLASFKLIRVVSCTFCCGHQGKHFQRSPQDPILLGPGYCCPGPNGHRLGG